MGKGNGRRGDPLPKSLQVLWCSDSPWHTTGYGITTNHIARRMAADGHKVFVYAPGGFHGGSVEICPNVTVLSSDFGDDRWGNSALHHHVEGVQPDVVITWLDCQGLGEYGWTSVPTFMWRR